MGSETSAQKTHSGVIVPMVTPITAEGALDEPAVNRIVDHLIAGGVQGIFVLGTAGECPSTPREIRSRLVSIVVERVAGRVKVLAGISDTVVSESVDAGREYLRRGVAAVVSQLPSYYTLTPDEQFRYFSTILKRLTGQVLLYDIPATVHMPVDPGVIEHLRAFPNLVGIKDSSGDSQRLTDLLKAYAGDSGFSVLVGTTALASFGLRHGADGFVPSAGNLAPQLCARLYASARKGDSALMADLQREIDALQAELTPDGLIGRGIARLKRRMALRGLCGPTVFPPLAAAED